MRCHQCPRPALYKITDQEIPLCLECYQKWQSIQNIQFLQNAAMMNQALDDMDEISGIPSVGGRIPVTALARAMQKSHVYNNINVSNSNVGVINTGDLAKIDAAITITEGSDIAGIGQHLKALVQAVIDGKDLDPAAKREIIEMLETLSEQIVGSRKKSVIMTLLKSVEERAKGANSIIQLIGTLTGLVRSVLGV
jgi:hypothetical protein